MGDLKEDIAKYLRGEMSPSQMHALEKKALSDPFLADAIEGARLINSADLSDDLADLRAKIRTPRSTKVLSLWTWPARIAAAIALVGLASYFIVVINRESPDQHLAENKVSPESNANSSPAPVIPESADSISSPPPTTEALEQKPSRKAEADKTAEAAKGVRESDVVGLTDVTAPAIEPVADSGPEKESLPHDAADAIITEGATAQATPPRSIDAMTQLEQSVRPRQSKLISGTVVDAEDGRALPGVNVTIAGTTIGTTTDEEGRYVVSTDSLNAGLHFSFIGYENKVIDATSGNIDVMLNPDISELSEVVVVGYGGTKREDLESDPIIEIAEPAGGRRAYKQYLVENLRYPEQALNNQVEGRVTVQFTIDPSGKMSDFKVLKGLGYGCDEEVIRLIRQGPKWKPSRRNTEPVADKIKVRMKFNLPKK